MHHYIPDLLLDVNLYYWSLLDLFFLLLQWQKDRQQQTTFIKTPAGLKVVERRNRRGRPVASKCTSRGCTQKCRTDEFNVLCFSISKHSMFGVFTNIWGSLVGFHVGRYTVRCRPFCSFTDLFSGAKRQRRKQWRKLKKPRQQMDFRLFTSWCERKGAFRSCGI